MNLFFLFVLLISTLQLTHAVVCYACLYQVGEQDVHNCRYTSPTETPTSASSCCWTAVDVRGSVFRTAKDSHDPSFGMNTCKWITHTNFVCQCNSTDFCNNERAP